MWSMNIFDQSKLKLQPGNKFLDGQTDRAPAFQAGPYKILQDGFVAGNTVFEYFSGVQSKNQDPYSLKSFKLWDSFPQNSENRVGLLLYWGLIWDQKPM